MPIGSDGSFQLNHTYKEEGSFDVRLTLHDNEDNPAIQDSETFRVDVLLAGVDVHDASHADVLPGHNITVSEDGVIATLFHARGSVREASIIVAVVPTFVAAGLEPSFHVSPGERIGAAY